METVYTKVKKNVHSVGQGVVKMGDCFFKLLYNG